MKRKASGTSQGKYVLKRRKTTKSLSKAQVKTMKRIANAAARKADELKYFKYGAGTELDIKGTASSTASYNIFYHSGSGLSTIARGTGDNQFLGDKIRWKGISIKYTIVNGKLTGTTPPWAFSNQPVKFEVILFRSPQLYTSSSYPYTALFNDTTTDAYNGFLSSEVKILKKKVVNITPAKASDGFARSGSMWLRMDKTIEFKDFETGYNMKDGQNYYLMFVNKSLNGDKTFFSFAYQNYFIDS